MESNIKNHLKALIQLSIIDRDFGQPEKTYVYAIGKANRVSEMEIDELVREVLNSKGDININFDGLLSEERFDYLYDIIQLMKIDGEVFLTEIKYCEEIAGKLGYEKKAVEKMSAGIYADPTITANREALMKEANKFLK